MYLELRVPSIGEGERLPLRERCPVCGNVAWRSHGWVAKSVRDPGAGRIRVQRVRCTRCGRTLRLYPPGLGRGGQSEPLRALSVFLWSLGASYRDIEGALSGLGYRLGHSSICQNVHRLLAESPPWLHERLARRRLHALDLDEGPSWVEDRGGLLLHIDNGAKEVLLGVELAEGEDPEVLGRTLAERLEALRKHAWPEEASS